MCAYACENMGDPEGLLVYSEKLYAMLEKCISRKYSYYEYAIKSVLCSMIDDLSSENKTLMFKLMLAVSTHPDEL